MIDERLLTEEQHKIYSEGCKKILSTFSDTLASLHDLMNEKGKNFTFGDVVFDMAKFISTSFFTALILSSQKDLQLQKITHILSSLEKSITESIKEMETNNNE